MTLKEATNAIGNALVACADTGPDGNFATALFPVPDQFFAEAGRASLVCRFDGIAADDWNKYAELPNPPKTPSDLRFEVRVYHPPYGPAEENVSDGYGYAQDKVLEGVSEFYSNLREDITLGGLVMDVLVNGSLTGDLVDPRARTEYYGEEIILIASIY